MSAQTLEAGDTAELETLFDSIARTVKPRPAPVVVKPEAQPDEAGDNAALEDLFDSIAQRAKAPSIGADLTGGNDSTELEDLFDSVLAQTGGGQAATLLAAAGAVEHDATQCAAKSAQAAAQLSAESAAHAAECAANSAQVAALISARAAEHEAAECAANKVVNTVGHLTRQLHDTLAELGYDRHLQDAAVAALPDARQRIAYVVSVTEQAASRALNAVDIAIPLQERLATDAASLSSKWDNVFSGECDVEQFKALAQQTREYLKAVPEHTEVTRAQLREVMMAQEFQDLTGQVLKRITEVANNLETQLLKLLVENAPAPIKNTEALGLLNGPAIQGGTPDVVGNQAQVDELLESLGF
jgi:chemotaxis protein CheZ